ncbi:MAG: type VI secretion system tip protein TssI/VgrG [Candidatus Desantisbacteria bacterium]
MNMLKFLKDLLEPNTAHFLFDCPVSGLGVLSFTGSEGISQPYRFEIRLVSNNSGINFDDILFKRATLTIRCNQTDKRYIHGIISRFSQHESGAHHTVYVAELVPMVWLLSLRAQSRVFQNMSVDEIVKKILTDAGFGGKDYKFLLQKKYLKREYCIQYRESDFNFISRLLEEEGIFYYFQHESQGEVLIINDLSDTCSGCLPEKGVGFHEHSGDIPPEVQYVYECLPQQGIISGKVTLNDFNYEKPAMLLLANENSVQIKNPNLEVYDYPGEYNQQGEGERLAKIRMREIDAHYRVITGKSNWRSMDAGYKMTLTDHYRSDLNVDYLITQVNHYATHASILSYGESEKGTSYNNQFKSIPFKVNYHPPRVTPRPTVKGTQTATVVGPSKEKIYFDEFGRVKVQFHWDREGKRDDKSSCWVRVSQGYAGANHGMQFMPLIGDEVIVDFLEGDPDKPIITGRVYNGNNMPRLKPENKVQNVIYTPYQHRLMLDDKGAHITLNTGGGEVLFMGDGGKDKSDHGNNIKISTFDKHFMHMAEGKEMKGIVVSTLKKNMVVLDDKEENIIIQTTNGHIAVLDDKNKKIAITSTDGHSVTIDDKGKHITLVDKSGDNMFKIDIGGKKLIISTKQGNIDILAPAGTIKMQANKIEAEAKTDVKIKGMNITSEASMAVKTKGMNVTSEASMAQKMKGTMTTVEGGAMTTVKGGLVKIN